MLSQPLCQLSVGVHSEQGQRDRNEDHHCISIDDKYLLFGDLRRVSFFAIFDGHGGSAVSLYLKTLLLNTFRNLIAKLCVEDSILDIDSFISNEFPTLEYEIIKSRIQSIRQKESVVENLIHLAFIRADILLKDKYMSYAIGSTAVVAILCDNTLYVSNIGDSEAIISEQSGNEIIIDRLSVLHNVTNEAEKSRIVYMGGKVFFGRVFGRLMTTRSFGDFEYKIPREKKDYINVEPHITALDLDKTHRYMILSCDGLWERLSYKEGIEYVQN